MKRVFSCCTVNMLLTISDTYYPWPAIVTHTHTQLFNGLLSGTTRVDRYQKKHSPTHTHTDHRTSFIIFLHFQRSMESSLFSIGAWQSSRTTSLQVLFGLPLGLGPSASYSMHFFTQSSSSFRSTCPYQRSLFCCSTNAMSSIPSLSLSCLLGSLPLGLGPCTSYFFTQSLSFFHSTCPYHCSLFCCNTNAMSSLPISLSAPYLEMIHTQHVT